MRYIHTQRALALAGLIASIALAPAVQAQSCNEQCLKGFLHRYLTQLPKHDPGSLAVAADVQARENSMPVPLGEGSWKNVMTVLPGLEFADPVSHQVIYAGGVRRGDGLGALFLRLKVDGGKITESEMLTTGAGAVMPPRPAPAAQPGGGAGGGPGGGPPPAPDLSGLMYPDVLYDATVPVGRRLDREHLMQIPYLYMEGLAKADGSVPPFGPRCDRWSSGRKATNNPSARGGAITCAAAVDGVKRMQGRAVENRRVVVVDLTHGIAVGMFIMVSNPGGQQLAQNVGEVFKVVDGRIRSIEEFAVPGRVPPASGYPGQ